MQIAAIAYRPIPRRVQKKSLTQRRQGAKKSPPSLFFAFFLCAFAPLREVLALAFQADFREHYGYDPEGETMLGRYLGILGCAAVMIGVALIPLTFSTAPSAAPVPEKQPAPSGDWAEVQPGVWRSSGMPASYALVDKEAAVLIDAPAGADWTRLKAHGVKRVELVLFTHHHRDTCARVGELLDAGVPVRAPKASADWLTPDNVAKYWQESLPLRNSRTAYLVVPVGFKGIDCSLEDNQAIRWRDWTIQVVATPGHSRDHIAFAVRKASGGREPPVSPPIVFCGDAMFAPGKIWSPYTTDWDHWTDQGLKPAAASLRKLAELKPAVICPAHGAPIKTDAVAALTKTAEAVEEVGFLKSFERFTKQRLGNAPKYDFLAPDQKESAGEKPWTRVSEHLYLTGNTYVLISKDNAILVMDPWGKRSVDQIAKLRADRKLGPIEVVMFSHAHYDHYDGIYDLPGYGRGGVTPPLQVWALDLVAQPLAEPLRFRAPFVDARPVKFDRRLKDGETATWGEYRFRFHHFPGQSHFTMAVETEIDGKRCWFTADNFFHQDQFSGTGGWMGLNRSWPLPYAASAQKILDARPEWVLAEHGGPFVFDAEDFRRRVRWGDASAKAADALSPTGNHRHDWDPSRIAVEPLVRKAKPGATLNWTLNASNPLERRQTLKITLLGRGVIEDQTLELDVPPGGSAKREFTIRLGDGISKGRHVFALRVMDGENEDGADVFLAVDVER